MLNALKKTVKYMVYLLPPVVLFGSFIEFGRIPGAGAVTFSRVYWLVLVVLALMLAVKTGFSSRQLGAAKKYCLFFILMIGYAALSLIWVRNRGSSFGNEFIFQFVGILTVLILTFMLTSLFDLRIFLRVVAVCYAITVLLGIYEIFTGNFGFTPSYKAYILRNDYGLFFPYAEFYNTNDYASFVSMFLPFAGYSAVNSWKGPGGKILACVGAAAGIFTVFCANARICYFAIVLFVVTLLLALMFKESLKKFRRRILLTFASGFGIIVLLAATSLVHIKVLLNELRSINFNDHSIKIRFDLIRGAFRMLWHSRLMGVGVGNSVALIPQYSTLKPINLHNLPLQILTEYGIIIFALYVLMTVGAAKRYFKYQGSVRTDVFASICFASVLELQLVGMASSDMMRVTGMWMIFGIIIVGIKVLYPVTDSVASNEDSEAENKEK
ncbi:MAG TPA: O-antigen ligase family protein [Clostridia bacterium]|nr:O-antigen ligase family protein [Clostridia bacterium]